MKPASQMEEEPKDVRIRTYVDGLDETLGGGVPHGSVVLISGLPGTMKSSLVYNILYHNSLQDGRNTLYITLEQGKKSLERQMSRMGYNGDQVTGRLHILDVATLQRRTQEQGTALWIDFLQRAIEFRKEIGVIDLIAIDSLEALEVLAKFTDRRHELFQLFDWLRAQEATSFLITERPPEPSLAIVLHSQGNEADYLADGIVHMKMHQVTDVEVQRRIRVIKMRSANHRTGYYALVFDKGKFRVTRAMSGP